MGNRIGDYKTKIKTATAKNLPLDFNKCNAQLILVAELEQLDQAQGLRGTWGHSYLE